ncbi:MULTISPECIES: glycosyl hydrolase family 95 catalytic domain-containing protein [unclassified Paenibacillus]|uniref:glycosyl hydrolase family 95 catalytic domain-containing protein n=1 Tax=unclassified Paenibacillus TaxID=185978 RepID=UPI00363E2145
MIQDHIDWPSFLGRHDMTWSVKPISWDDGAYIGNGTIGAMIYSEEHRDKRNVLRFVLGRTDVTARKSQGGYPPRVPVGELHLELVGWIYQPISIRVDLWNAELRAEITTTVGTVKVRAFVHSVDMALAVELETSPEEADAKLQWYAFSEVDPVLKNADGTNLNQYIPQAEVKRYSLEDTSFGVQQFSPQGGCTTAWKQSYSAENLNRRYLYLSIANGADESVQQQVAAVIREASAQSWEPWVESHRSWWHDYYQQSFVSIPDTMLEGFYWIQMYKLASATRADGMIIDNQGPWLAPTPWAGVWFNMNVQMSYSPVYTSNRLHLGESLVRAFRNNFDHLANNVPEPYRADSSGLPRSCSYDLINPVGTEIGNLTWICHNLWRQYRYSMDEKLLGELVYPLLKRSVQYYLHLLEEGDDGKLHLPPTVSPEYGSFLQMTVPDTHYDLTLLQWGCETLLLSSELLGLQEEDAAIRGRWRETLERLVPLPVDETGFMIGKDQPLEFGHRHFSHLMAVFPLHLISGDDENERELIVKTLRHWFSMEGDLRGFTFTSAASIAAALGEGQEALSYLKSFMHLIKPNTMYKEAGPVMESPLAAAEGIQDMLLQSWGDTIRVFPAIPSEWTEAVFHNLRTEGAFLVSAVRSAGVTSWIRIKSLAGQPCRIQTGMTGNIRISGVESTKLRQVADGVCVLDLKEGQEVILYAKIDSDASAPGGEPLADEKLWKIEPVEADSRLCGYFGSRKPWRLYGLPIK